MKAWNRLLYVGEWGSCLLQWGWATVKTNRLNERWLAWQKAKVLHKWNYQWIQRWILVQQQTILGDLFHTYSPRCRVAVPGHCPCQKVWNPQILVLSTCDFEGGHLSPILWKGRNPVRPNGFLLYTVWSWFMTCSTMVQVSSSLFGTDSLSEPQ